MAAGFSLTVYVCFRSNCPASSYGLKMSSWYASSIISRYQPREAGQQEKKKKKKKRKSSVPSFIGKRASYPHRQKWAMQPIEMVFLCACFTQRCRGREWYLPVEQSEHRENNQRARMANCQSPFNDYVHIQRAYTIVYTMWQPLIYHTKKQVFTLAIISLFIVGLEKERRRRKATEILV